MTRVAGAYRDFWVMLAMIGGAVFAANTTSKPGTASHAPVSSLIPSRNQIVTAPVTTPTRAQEKALPASQTSVVTATPASAEPSPTSSSTANATSVSEAAPSFSAPTPQSTEASPGLPITQPTSGAPEPDPYVFDGLIASIEKSEATTIAPAVDPFDKATPPPAARFAYIRLPLELRDGPGPKYIVVGSLGQNALVSLMEQEAGWTHVSAGDAIGWVPPGMISSSPVLSVARKPTPAARSVETPRREGGR
ncbi:hypothetical protein GGD54_006007 [Rhizobium tropici]|uniref:SH3 domain-containing protein n=3 Tax=Rhizobium TaxID=379 RepID=A0A1C3XGV0_9HYPH|nr:hypothetical protein [Rhizobium tropici]MBB5596517.1 hypothetical protein [Rhizobium tropici]MBB6489245.1 hypothetical protein [Rhizobium lusitanum]MBB6495493.1 hypothetical protein [Rhizobium tropici]SCB51502.1 hypothetical protein GA0061101_14023 [Rhizobium lusitanum]